ncbi:MAG: translesion error-prone DNA polymerase V autoproteolytic subunit [Candidatus Cloacimonetes bacterium]|nr:translesion error-prone DNA polymerase V autoproteolytic subunit [Candidatus Cloacimonadota bacterium]
MKLRNDGSIKAIFTYQEGKKLFRPLMASKISAGFPSPAQDYVEGKLDLNEYMIAHPASTFFVRVDGYSMVGAGIQPNDILVVDRSLEAVNNRIVIAIVEGELTVKRLKIEANEYYLMPESEDYPSIHIVEDMDFAIWGVVTFVIHKV